jgi:hypothetical protein
MARLDMQGILEIIFQLGFEINPLIILPSNSLPITYYNYSKHNTEKKTEDAYLVELEVEVIIL